MVTPQQLSDPTFVESQVDLAAEFNLIPVIIDTTQSLQKMNDPQEIAKKAAAFKSRLQHCRDLLESTPGLELNVEEQTKQLELLRKQYKEKCALFVKYKDLPVFVEALGKQE